MQQTSLFDEDTLSCLICGLKSNQLISHVTRVHKISTSEYYLRFPGSCLSRMTEAQKKKISDAKSKKDSKNKKIKMEKRKRREEVSSLEMLKCRLCQYESSLSLISHIMNKHGVKMNEYRAIYPGDQVQRASPSQSKKLSEKMKSILENEEEKKRFLEWRSFPSEMKHWIRKGVSEEEAKEKVAEFQRFQSLKGNNDKTRLLRHEKNLGDKNPMSLMSISEKHSISIEEARKLTPCFGRSGPSHPMFGKKHSEEALKKIAGAHHLSNPSYRSTGEIELENECRKISDDVKANFRISRWNVDIIFVSKNIIVEFFGDYWHMNPLKYKDDDVHSLYKKTALQVRERDNRKLNELKKLGYQVIVIWEHDWRYNRVDQIKRINDAFNSI